MPLPYLAAGVGLGVSQRSRNKRTQAASNKFSKRFPLLEDCVSMEASIKRAQIDLKNLVASPASTAKAKREKKTDESALRSWINTMKSHLRDLKCGLNVSSSSNVVIPVKQQVVEATPIVAQISEMESPEINNLASDTKKKGVNWLLIGGVAVFGIVIFKMLKKK
jgi:hypothetical protein